MMPMPPPSPAKELAEPPMEEAMESQSGSPTITLPGGYAPEDGKQEGDEVQALVTFKIGPNGDATIISVDGAKYGSKPKTPPSQGQQVMPVTEQGGSSFTDRLMQAKQRMEG